MALKLIHKFFFVSKGSSWTDCDRKFKCHLALIILKKNKYPRNFKCVMLPFHVFYRKPFTESSCGCRSWRNITSLDRLSCGSSATRQTWATLDRSQSRYKNGEAHLKPIYDRFMFTPAVCTSSHRRDTVWLLTGDYVLLKLQHCQGITSMSCCRMSVGVWMMD